MASFLKPMTGQVTLRHLVFITHEVPSERVRKHVPDPFELESFQDENGMEKSFVTVGCFFNEDLSWSMAPRPSHSFEQITHRTYVRYKDKIGSYFFATDLGTLPGFALQRPAIRRAALAEIRIRQIPDELGYCVYSCRSSGSNGDTRFELHSLRPVQGAEEEQHAQHITYRLHGFSEASLGLYVDQIVRHRAMTPHLGELHSGYFGFWERLGILTPGEAARPRSVLIEPAIEFELYPALPVRLLIRSAFPSAA